MRKTKYPTNPKTFGERIRKLRMDKKLSVADLAKLIGISESYLWRIEENKQTPSVEKAALIADILEEHPLDYFLWATKKGKSPLETKGQRDSMVERLGRLGKKMNNLISKNINDKELEKTVHEFETMLALIEKSLPKSKNK